MKSTDQPPNHFDHIIVGGGIAGSSLAFELTYYSDSILLVDAEHEGKATNAGAGIISGATTFSDNPDMYDLVREASKYYPEFIKKLENYTSVPTSYDQSDLVITLRDEGLENQFNAKVAQILDRQKHHNYPEKGTIAEISAETFSQSYPALSPVIRALRYTGAAQVDGKQLNNAIHSAASKAGISELEAEITQVQVQEDIMVAVTSDKQRYMADNIIIAGGAWSKRFEEQLDYKVEVFPQRGQIIHFNLADQKSSLPIIIAMNDYYSLARTNSKIIVGATRESDSGFDPSNSVEGVIQILQNGIRLIPGLRKAEIDEIRVGLRPYSQDKLPFIGRIPGYEHLWILTGHGPLGLTAGPYSAKLLAERMNGMQVTELDPFDPSRDQPPFS